MNISLTSELEEFVKTQVDSGHETSASEGIQAPLELSRQQAKLGQVTTADEDYFEKKRQRVRDKYLSHTAA